MPRERDLAVSARLLMWNPQMPSSVDLCHFTGLVDLCLFMGLIDDLLTRNKMGGQVCNSLDKKKGGKEEIFFNY